MVNSDTRPMPSFGESKTLTASMSKGTCRLCMGPIQQGESLWPLPQDSAITGKSAKGKFNYVHKTCAEVDARARGLPLPLEPPVCKHWRKRGSCAFGDACFFAHPSRSTQDDSDSGAASHVASSKGKICFDADGRRVRKRKVVANDSRAFAFRAFLLDTFGRTALARGSGVLDVGGGNGELAFQLVNLNRGTSAVHSSEAAGGVADYSSGSKEIPSPSPPLPPTSPKPDMLPLQATVVDPRPLRLRRYVRKAAFGMYTRNTAFNARYNDGCARRAIVPEDLRAPLHLRVFFETAKEWTGRARPTLGDASMLGSHAHSSTTNGEHSGGRNDWPCAIGDGNGDGNGVTSGRAVSSEAAEVKGAPLLQPSHFPALANREAYEKALSRARAVSWTRKGLVHEETVSTESDGEDGNEKRCTTRPLKECEGAEDREMGTDEEEDQLASDRSHETTTGHCTGSDDRLVQNEKESSIGPASSDFHTMTSPAIPVQTTEPPSPSVLELATSLSIADRCERLPMLRQREDPALTLSASTSFSSLSYEEAVAAVAGASLVAGLHPDQAASEIVAFATARRVPFAVVPCCVYSVEFPFRRVPAEGAAGIDDANGQKGVTRDWKITQNASPDKHYLSYLRGRKVKNYDDLIDWLVAIGPKGTQTAVLPFEGKNICVFWTGDNTHV